MPVADTSVRHYLSSHASAPGLSGQAGSLTNLMAACLVDGYGSVTLTSLAVASDIATATVSGGHGFTMLGGASGVGPVIRIAGAAPSELNGDWRIDSVPDSTTFTFLTADLSDQTATGTITAKIAPADWVRVFSGTNKAAYSRPAGSGSTAMLLRVDDSTTTYARVRGYEEMTDVDTGSGLFPTADQLANMSWSKSDAADASARAWTLIADGRRLLYIPKPWNAYPRHVFLFGDLVSHYSADGYQCLMAGLHGATNTVNNNYNALTSNVANWPAYLARGVSQVGGSVTAACLGGLYAGVLGATAGITYPNPGPNTLLLRGEVEYKETVSGGLRGRWPGLYPTPHLRPLPDSDMVAGLAGDGSRRLMAVAFNMNVGMYETLEGRVFVDLLDWS